MSAPPHPARCLTRLLLGGHVFLFAAKGELRINGRMPPLDHELGEVDAVDLDKAQVPTPRIGLFALFALLLRLFFVFVGLGLFALLLFLEKLLEVLLVLGPCVEVLLAGRQWFGKWSSSDSAS